MEWIKCSDKLPEPSKDVLVLNKDGRMGVSRYFYVYSLNNYTWQEVDDQFGFGTPTHWMPLPKPPQE